MLSTSGFEHLMLTMPERTKCTGHHAGVGHTAESVSLGTSVRVRTAADQEQGYLVWYATLL